MPAGRTLKPPPPAVDGCGNPRNLVEVLASRDKIDDRVVRVVLVAGGHEEPYAPIATGERLTGSGRPESREDRTPAIVDLHKKNGQHEIDLLAVAGVDPSAGNYGGRVSAGNDAPGWDAITAVFTSLYPGQEPRHIGYTPGVALGSGLQGCSAYRASDHWHFVSYGLTELWSKEEGSLPAISGWGYELTVRVATNDADPPQWPYALLEVIARHTQQNDHPFAVGDRLDTGHPITGRNDTTLEVLAFASDPQIEPRATPNGTLEFRQLLGITRAELADMKRRRARPRCWITSP